MANYPEEVVNYFELACYQDLSLYIQQCSQVEELNDILNLINTHEIRRIVKNSIKNQVKLISLQYEYLAKEVQANNSSPSIFNTELIKTRKEAEELLSSNFNWLDKRLASVDNKIAHFRTALREWIETYQNESYESSLVWGFLGGIVLGPIGSFAGAVIGGAMNSGPAGTEFEREYNNLIVDYNHLLNEVKESLDDSLELSLELFGQVNQKFQASNSNQLSGQRTLLDRLLPWRK
jgi:hypothetical protein